MGHHRGNDCLEIFRVYVEDADARAVVGHDLGIGASDAAGTAGHDDRLAPHIEHLLQSRHLSSRAATLIPTVPRLAGSMGPVQVVVE